MYLGAILIGIMKKIFKNLLIFLVIISAAIVLVLAYVGVVPGLSAVFVKQKDLGVHPDPQQVSEINAQIGHEVILDTATLPQAGQPVYEGSIELAGSYSDQQVTSVLDSWSKNWAITPFYNVQVKIHEDGTAEASGILKVKEAISLAKHLGYSEAEIETAAGYATSINGDLPVYMMGSASVDNNQVSADISNLQIGTVTVPTAISSQIVSAVEDAVQRRMQQVPTLDIKSMNLTGGKVNISGMVPQIERGDY